MLQDDWNGAYLCMTTLYAVPLVPRLATLRPGLHLPPLQVGSVNNTFGIQGVTESNGCYFLKSVEDAHALRTRIRWGGWLALVSSIAGAASLHSTTYGSRKLHKLVSSVPTNPTQLHHPLFCSAGPP